MKREQAKLINRIEVIEVEHECQAGASKITRGGRKKMHLNHNFSTPGIEVVGAGKASTIKCLKSSVLSGNRRNILNIGVWRGNASNSI